MRIRAAVLVGFAWAWALALGQTCPTVCVIIPEEDRCIIPRPVSDPACETAIIQAFLSYGFHVVDQQQVKFPRTASSRPGALIEDNGKRTKHFGLRFGTSPRDIARAVAKQLASRMGWRCR